MLTIRGQTRRRRRLDLSILDCRVGTTVYLISKLINPKMADAFLLIAL